MQLAHQWIVEDAINGGNNSTVNTWHDTNAALLLTGSGTPTFLESASPVGGATIRFDGGSSEDVFSGGVVNRSPYALNEASSFTLALVFKPRGESEVGAGSS